MPQFQLILTSLMDEHSSIRTVIDISATDLEQARSKALIHLRGYPEQWQARLDDWDGLPKKLKIDLDPGAEENKIGVVRKTFLNQEYPAEPANYVIAASVVECRGEIDLVQIRKDIIDWGASEQIRLQRAEDEVEFERLRGKLGR